MGMGWVQRNKRHGALLAFAAVVLQIALAFGHVHLNARWLTGESRLATAAQHHGSLAQSLPQPPAQNPGDDDDYCPICASIFLASSASAPAPPQLLVPANLQRVEHSFDAARPLTEPRRLAFRSRAPPVA
jgi:hypothetical protein